MALIFEGRVSFPPFSPLPPFYDNFPDEERKGERFIIPGDLARLPVNTSDEKDARIEDASDSPREFPGKLGAAAP